MALKINLLKLKEYGTVAEVRQDVVRITGLNNCMNGQMLALGEGGIRALVVGYDPDYVLGLVLDSSASVKPGDRALATMDEFKVPVGDAFVGRRVNALCEPIDGHGPVKESMMHTIFTQAPTVLERVPLAEVMATGTKIVDMLKPVGKGQRMLIIGDRMTGKTTMATDAIINQRGKNIICIYCVIGKSEALVNRLSLLFERRRVWDYSFMVAATASDPIGQQYLAPYVACSLGEYFMYQKNMDVLVVFDDFTKHAWAYRQISLLLERAPGRDAYPGDIFYIHSQLVERAGKLRPERGGGSMTHFPIVETLQGDVAGYIPSNIISMTDGQIYFNSTLFGEGFKPAIDMGLSVSRIGNRVQWPAVKRMTGMLQVEFVRYKELEKLTRIKAGVSGDVEKRLNRGRVLEELLKQDADDPVPLEDQVLVLFALKQGMLADVAPEQTRRFLKQWIHHIHTQRADLIDRLVETNSMTDDIQEGLDEEATRFTCTSV